MKGRLDLRISDAERQEWVRRAEESRMSLSAWIRWRCNDGFDSQGFLERLKTPVDSYAKVQNQTIREALEKAERARVDYTVPKSIDASQLCFSCERKSRTGQVLPDQCEACRRG